MARVVWVVSVNVGGGWGVVSFGLIVVVDGSAVIVGGGGVMFVRGVVQRVEEKSARKKKC